MPLAEIPRRLGLADRAVLPQGRRRSKLEQLVADLREQGYYEARADHQLRPGPTAPPEPGDQRRRRRARSPSSSRAIRCRRSERRDLVPIEREGSVDEDLLEDSANRIREHLRAQGYRDADAEYARTPRDGGLAVVFTVRRGPQFRTARVTIAGATCRARSRSARAAAHARRRPVRPRRRCDPDAATLAEQYRRRGYTQVRVDPVSVPAGRQRASPVPVDVRFDRHRRARDRGRRRSPSPGRRPSTRPRCAPAITSRTGQPYYQQQVALDRDGMLLVLLNRGYSVGRLDARVTFSAGSIVCRRGVCRRRRPAGLRRARARSSATRRPAPRRSAAK